MKARLLAIFTSLPEVGGHTTTTIKLCELLRPMFGEICVLIKDIPGHGFSEAARDEIERAGARTIRLSLGNPWSWRKIPGGCRNADVFLAIGMRHLSPALALLIGARQSVYYHITHELSRPVLRQLRINARVFTKLVFISPATLQDYSGPSRSPEKPFWALQPTELPPGVASVRERPPGPVRFGFLGRLTDEKGAGFLADLIGGCPVPCELHIAGRGPQEANLRKRQASRPDRFFVRGSFAAPERAEFLGRFFSGIDRLCVPSLDDREGIPNVILEALQFGVPILATRSGGMRSFEMGELGPADPEAIRLVAPAEYPAALSSLASGPPPSDALRKRCRDYFETYFSDAVLAGRWRKIFSISAGRSLTVPHLEFDSRSDKGPRPMKPRRVLVVSPSGRNIGGAEVMLDQFLASAKIDGIDVHVVFLEGGDHFEETTNAGHSCEMVPAGRLRQPLQWLRASWVLRRILRDFKPDLVVGWQSKAIAYAGYPARLAGVPFFCFHRGDPGRTVIDRIGYILPCDGYLANSSFTAGKLSVYTRRPITIIHSSVDFLRFDSARATKSAELKARFGFDPGQPLVGIVGRLQRWKGIHIFAKAITKVRENHPRCQSVIVGGSHGIEPDYVEYLEKYFSSNARGGHPRMVGAQKNVHEWMQAMDVVVHASDQEPFGLVVIEAMSLGKPVVASIPGGPAEVIEHGVSGLLVRHGDDRALAEAIDRFLKDSDFAERCGRRARESALKYDGANYARRIIQAIDDLRAG